MADLFSPTRQDVERYRRLRALSVELGHRIVQTIPKHGFEEVGDAIGVRRNGILLFDSEDMAGVLADCCLYDWFENGKNLVQRYAETYPATPGTDEAYLLNAYTRADYRILMVESAVPDAGIHCTDALNNDRLFVMDLGLSHSLGGGGVIATRTIPLGEYWMTGGAGLPINSEMARRNALGGIVRRKNESFEAPGSFALAIVRGCLSADAADWVRYESSEAKSKKARIEPRFSFKRRRVK